MVKITKIQLIFSWFLTAFFHRKNQIFNFCLQYKMFLVSRFCNIYCAMFDPRKLSLYNFWLGISFFIEAICKNLRQTLSVETWVVFFFYSIASIKNFVSSDVSGISLIYDLIHACTYLSIQSWDVIIHRDREQLEFVIQVLFFLIISPYFLMKKEWLKKKISHDPFETDFYLTGLKTYQ